MSDTDSRNNTVQCLFKNVKTVGDFLACNPSLSFAPEENIPHIVRTLHGHHAGAAGIVGPQNSFCGMLIERDILAHLVYMTDTTLDSTPDSATLTAGDVMMSSPVCLTPQAGLAEAMDIMARCGFRYMPVVEDGRLLGIVDSRDLLIHVNRQIKAAVADKDYLLNYLMHHEPYGGAAHL